MKCFIDEIKRKPINADGKKKLEKGALIKYIFQKKTDQLEVNRVAELERLISRFKNIVVKRKVVWVKH